MLALILSTPTRPATAPLAKKFAAWLGRAAAFMSLLPDRKTTCPWIGWTLALALQATIGNLCCLAHEGPHPSSQPTPADAKQVYAPGKLPDRIVLTWSAQPARSQTVTWRTDTTIEQGYAEINLAGPGPQFAERALRVAAQRTPFTSDLSTCHYHRVTWNELRPGTKYAYRVGDGVNWSEWLHFTTPVEQPAPFEFVYFGDAQNDIKSHWSRVVREAQADAPRARFMLHAGDLVNAGNQDAEWGQWFGAGGWLNGMIPTVACAGNHEYATEPDGSRGLTRHWAAQFAFPQNGPAGLQTSVYFFDYQGARIVVLNSMERLEEQARWLDEVLTNHRQKWTILAFHFPIFSAAAGRDNQDVRRHWKPIIDKHRVDLVLQGHDHTYARTGLAVPENLDQGANLVDQGTVYVVSVSGPKLYDVQRRPFQKRTGSGIQLYQIVSIDGDQLRYRACTADGQNYDGFTLRKRPGQTNELVDQIPAGPDHAK